MDAPTPIARALALLAEPLRARIVDLLADHELSVGELARILQAPQPTVSRHLKPLQLAGWLQRKTHGTATLTRLDPTHLSDAVATLIGVVRDDPDRRTERAADRERLALVLAERDADADTFFSRVASGWDSLRDQLFGRRFMAAAMAAMVPDGATVVDLGCGTGETLLTLAPFCGRAIGIDREPSMLATARARLAAHPHVTFHEALLEALPLPTGAADTALAVLVLHHLAHPAGALTEAARVLSSAGRLVVVDMQPHDAAALATFGHRHRGFSEEALAALAAEAGLALTRFTALPADPEAQGPPLFVATLAPSPTRSATAKKT